jgi:hypothetical protein
MSWPQKHSLTKQEVAEIIADFLAGSGDRWDWDDFTSGMSLEDPYLEKIRLRCAGLADEFPPDRPERYCNEDGLRVMRQCIEELKSSGSLDS